MRSRGLLRAVVLIGFALGNAGSSDAAIITSFGAINSPGSSTIGPVGVTPAPNNDNTATTSANVIGSSVFFNNLGPLEIEFVAGNSGGTTEYSFNQTFTNVNTVPWLGFTFELGFGTGDDFVPVAAGTGLDFDTPDGDPLPTSSAYTLLNHQPTTIGWSGGVVNPLVGGFGPPFSVAFSFAIDVPDGLEQLHPGGLNRFTIRQSPITSTAPEPATTALFAIGVALAAARGRRRS